MGTAASHWSLLPLRQTTAQVTMLGRPTEMTLYYSQRSEWREIKQTVKVWFSLVQTMLGLPVFGRKAFFTPFLSMVRTRPHRVQWKGSCFGSWQILTMNKKKEKSPEAELRSLVLARAMYRPTPQHEGWKGKNEKLKPVLWGAHSTAEGPAVAGGSVWDWETLQRLQTGWLTPFLWQL